MKSKKIGPAIIFLIAGVLGLVVLIFYFWLAPYPLNDHKYQVYFSNKTFDPEMLDCEDVYPVSRISKGNYSPKDLLENSIIDLLRGPTSDEKLQGYFSSINDGVYLNSLKILSGVAYADFSGKLEEGVGGSCRVANIRSQIETTLKQFANIENVVISINGRVEDILQP